MGLEIPDEVKWLSWIIGQDWPEGDETAMRRLATAWQDAATSVDELTGDLQGTASSVLGVVQGPAADNFRTFWDQFVTTDPEYLPKLAELCRDLAGQCENGANDIEYGKYMFIALLIITAIQIAILIANMIETFGASAAAIPVVEEGAQIVAKSIARQLLEAILKNVLMSELQSVGLDVLIQGIQIAEGHRDGFDLSKTGAAAVDGLVNGVISGGVGFGAGKIPGLSGGSSPFSGLVKGAVRDGASGLVSGAAGAVASTAIHGGDLSPDALAKAATAGAFGGAVGGAKEGMHEGGHSGAPGESGPPSPGEPDFGGSSNDGGSSGDADTGGGSGTGSSSDPGNSSDGGGSDGGTGEHGGSGSGGGSADGGSGASEPGGSTGGSGDGGSGEPHVAAATSSDGSVPDGGHAGSGGGAPAGDGGGPAESHATGDGPAGDAGPSGSVAAHADGNGVRPDPEGGPGGGGADGAPHQASAAGGGAPNDDASFNRSSLLSTGGAAAPVHAPAAVASHDGGGSASHAGSASRIDSLLNHGAPSGGSPSASHGSTLADTGRPEAPPAPSPPDGGSAPGSDGAASGTVPQAAPAAPAMPVGPAASPGSGGGGHAPAVGEGAPPSSRSAGSGDRPGAAADRPPTGAPARDASNRAGTGTTREHAAATRDGSGTGRADGSQPRAGSGVGSREPGTAAPERPFSSSEGVRPETPPDSEPPATRAGEPSVSPPDDPSGTTPGDAPAGEPPAEHGGDTSEPPADRTASTPGTEPGEPRATDGESPAAGDRTAPEEPAGPEPAPDGTQEPARSDAQEPPHDEPAREPTDATPGRDGEVPPSDSGTDRAPGDASPARDVPPASDGERAAATEPGREGPDTGPELTTDDARTPEDAPETPADAGTSADASPADTGVPTDGTERDTAPSALAEEPAGAGPRDSATEPAPGTDPERRTEPGGHRTEYPPGATEPHAPREEPRSEEPPRGHDETRPEERHPGGAHDQEPFSPDEVNERHQEPTPAGSSYHRGDPEMGDLPQRVTPDPDGRYTVDVHVTPDGLARIGDRTYTPEELAEILRHNEDYNGEPIRLIGCDAASNDFARRLATELGTSVMAPDRPAWTDSQGRVFSSDQKVGPDGKARPKIPPNGEWEVHEPDGSTSRASDDGFAPGTEESNKHDLDPNDAKSRGDEEPPADEESSDEADNGRFRPPPIAKSFAPEDPAFDEKFVDYDRPGHGDHTSDPYNDPPRSPVTVDPPQGDRDGAMPGPPPQPHDVSAIPRSLQGHTLEPRTEYRVNHPNGTQTRFFTDDHGQVKWVEATPGEKGRGKGFNPDLDYPLLPDAQYRVNNFRDPTKFFDFHTDERGQTDSMTGQPHYGPSDGKHRDDSSSARYSAQHRAGHEGSEAYQGDPMHSLARWAGGHLAPNESGGPGEYVNMHPQMAASNSGHKRDGWTNEASWRRQEEQLATFHNPPNQFVENIQVRMVRDPATGIPDEVTMRWRQTEIDPETGARVTRVIQRTFPNVPANINFREMQRYG